MPFVLGRYEPLDNVLHLWHPAPVVLADRPTLEQFFGEVTTLIESCPRKPYLLVNFTNLEIGVEMTSEYQRKIQTYRPRVLGVFRYGLAEDVEGTLTRVAVRLANRAEPSIFPDEGSAREAVRQARSRAAGAQGRQK